MVEKNGTRWWFGPERKNRNTRGGVGARAAREADLFGIFRRQGTKNARRLTGYDTARRQLRHSHAVHSQTFSNHAYTLPMPTCYECSLTIARFLSEFRQITQTWRKDGENLEYADTMTLSRVDFKRHLGRFWLFWTDVLLFAYSLCTKMFICKSVKNFLCILYVLCWDD